MRHELPTGLTRRLDDYRRSLWRRRVASAAAVAVATGVAAWLAVLVADRFGETPAAVRGMLAGVVAAAVGGVAWAAYRWGWRYRRVEALAVLLGRRLPRLGDRLLGVIELSRDDREQSRSPALVRAAIDQVAADAERCDFDAALPPARRHRLAWGMAGVLAAGLLGLGALFPAAVGNAGRRLAMFWADVPRYTLTRIDPTPDAWVTPRGEPAVVAVRLADDSRWSPDVGRLVVEPEGGGATRVIDAGVDDSGRYRFELPAMAGTATATVRVGDVRRAVRLVPTPRPELTDVAAEVRLPKYLQLPDVRRVDARGGRVAVVADSRVAVRGEADRELDSMEAGGVAVPVRHAAWRTDEVGVDGSREVSLRWRSADGLDSDGPFDLRIDAVEDGDPVITVEGLPATAVVLDSEALSFEARVSDDFGVRRVGMAWRPMPGFEVETPQKGERLLNAGAADAEDLTAEGVFQATTLGIEPQPVELTVWAEDSRGEGSRVYSSPFRLFVLSPDQHAMWVTEQLNRWHRRALDVRDRERELFEANQTLRELAPEDLATPARREEIRSQAAAERANGRRLSALAVDGDRLIRQASRNDSIGVGHIEQWAAMLETVRRLADRRMPAVAELLEDAEAEAAGGKRGTADWSRTAGVGRGRDGGKKDAAGVEGKPPKGMSLSDGESSLAGPDEAKDDGEPGPPKPAKKPALRMPVTTVAGGGGGAKKPKPKASVMAAAVDEQEDLLREFDTLADEFNELLGNLEGSTLVKRLKAASRGQVKVAGELVGLAGATFGRPAYGQPRDSRAELKSLAERQGDQAVSVSHIVDDLAGYLRRRPLVSFQKTLDEMREVDVTGEMRFVGRTMDKTPGLSVSDCEYFADSLDRWADNLLDPACQGCCPGACSKESLPPSIVLEALRILEAEVTLRDRTRVAEQSWAATEESDYRKEAEGLAATQSGLNERVVALAGRIRELEDAEKHFGKELRMLADVDRVMGEAAEILRRPSTGVDAIAAETEVIELMLRSKKINPNGGGAGGSSPGGGGMGGAAEGPALALIGRSRDDRGVNATREVGQATGRSESTLPEEFRRGLDEYFRKLGAGS